MDESEIVASLANVSIANRHSTERGQEWGPRCSLDCQWICPIGGQLHYHSPGRAVIDVLPGDILFIPAREQNTLIVGAGGALTGFHGDWRVGETWAQSRTWLPERWRRKTMLRDSAQVILLMTRMANIFQNFAPYRQQRLRCLATEVLLTLLTEWTTPHYEQLDPRLGDMLSWMRERLPEAVSRADLAEAFSLSPAYINQLFKKDLGISPGAWVQRERCRLAYRYLLQNMSVSDAAERIGFADPSHFSRVFKKVYGVSPRKVRPS